MAKKFNGTINVDIRNSVEDWDAFTQPNPPKGSPNVVVLLWDDTGSFKRQQIHNIVLHVI